MKEAYQAKKTSISDDDEILSSFEYLENNREEFFNGYPGIFDFEGIF